MHNKKVSSTELTEQAHSSLSKLSDANRKAIEEGLAILGSLNGDTYTKDLRPTFQASIGAHFRHLIEHYQCFIEQLTGLRINYECRPRQAQLELDLPQAKSALEHLVHSFSCFPLKQANIECQLLDSQCDDEVFSSIGRELLFLQAHTVHHYAIIAAMMRSQDIEVPSDFGVAISTQRYVVANSNHGSLET